MTQLSKIPFIAYVHVHVPMSRNFLHDLLFAFLLFFCKCFSFFFVAFFFLACRNINITFTKQCCTKKKVERMKIKLFSSEVGSEKRQKKLKLRKEANFKLFRLNGMLRKIMASGRCLCLIYFSSHFSHSFFCEQSKGKNKGTIFV